MASDSARSPQNRPHFDSELTAKEAAHTHRALRSPATEQTATEGHAKSAESGKLETFRCPLRWQTSTRLLASRDGWPACDERESWEPCPRSCSTSSYFVFSVSLPATTLARTLPSLSISSRNCFRISGVSVILSATIWSAPSQGRFNSRNFLFRIDELLREFAGRLLALFVPRCSSPEARDRALKRRSPWSYVSACTAGKGLLIRSCCR